VAFRAVHAAWGDVFAHLPDLGCGQVWEAVWKRRPPAPLTCDECQHPMFAKVSRTGLRFFAHAPAAPNCALALETLAHHMLKLELANAARDAGAHAEMEVRGPDGAWRADVLASDPGGTWRMALEAQLAPIAADDITARTERMGADGVTSIWFSDRPPPPPWLGVVPSVRLAQPEDGENLIIASGLVKLGPCGCGDPGCRDSSWQPVPATPWFSFSAGYSLAASSPTGSVITSAPCPTGRRSGRIRDTSGRLRATSLSTRTKCSATSGGKWRCCKGGRSGCRDGSANHDRT